MNETRLAGWKKVEMATGAGRRLRAWHRPGEGQWPEVAAAWWRGELPGAREVHHSRGAQVEVAEAGGIRCYFKRFLTRGGSDRLKSVVRGSRGRRALLAGERLALMGFSVPRAVCLAEERAGPLVLDSLLVTEEVAGAENCGEWFTFEGGERPERWRLLEALGREAGRLHAAGVHHGDMRKTNVLFVRRGGGFDFYWLDNEGDSFHQRLPEGQRVHNLMQLNMDKKGISVSDRMRFWKAYLETAEVAPERERQIMEQVIEWTRRRWRKRGWL